jgi:polysaccharide lyase-like protein
MLGFQFSRVIGLLGGVVVAGVLGCSSDEESTTTNPLEPGAGDDSAVCQSSLFCDDFEAFAAGTPPSGAWTASQNNGTVSVDTTRAFRGSQSVKASTLATSETMATYKVALIGLTGAPVVPVPNEAVYGRMMFYLESAPSTNVHWTFIDATGTVPGQDYSATYRYGGQLPITDGATVGSQLMANYDTTDFYGTPPRGPQTDCYQHADEKVVPVGRWACAQWFFDGPNAQMRFWLDGQELTDLHVDGTGEGCVAQDPAYTWTAPTFTRLDVGWESYQADEARSIWIDDVVLSSTAVSCPAAP